MSQRSIYDDIDTVTATRVSPTHRADPDTSRAAAIDNGTRAGKQAIRVLEHLRDAGATGASDFELSAALAILRTAAGTRRLELQRLGLVADTGLRRRTDTNNPARVHRITERGERFLAALAARS